MHLRNSCARSTSACSMRQVPSGASGLRGLNFLMFFLTSKFQETSVTRSLISGKGLHGLDGDGLVERERIQARHAHELRHAVDFGRARAAFARFAVPAHGQIVGLFGLDMVDGVQHHHAFGDFGVVIAELAAGLVAAPNLESCVSFISSHSIICFCSSRHRRQRFAVDLHCAVRRFADRRG